MTTYPGSCHCGAIAIRFESDKQPSEMRVGRACTFCRWHSVPTSTGMAVSAEIITGDRRVIEYVLSPVLRYRDEAGRER